jgi:hypothetical protein
MKLFKLTALGLLSFALFMGLSSCEKESEESKVNVYTKTDIPGTGAQIAPNPSPSTGVAKLSVYYDKRTKKMDYTVSWSGLTDSVIAIRINGPAPKGYSAISRTFTVAAADSAKFETTPYTPIQVVAGTTPKALYPSTGSYTGVLYIDDVKAVQQDLLNSYYYVTIHTKTTLPVPGATRFFYRWFGEVRAQVVFQ